MLILVADCLPIHAGHLQLLKYNAISVARVDSERTIDSAKAEKLYSISEMTTKKKRRRVDEAAVFYFIFGLKET